MISEKTLELNVTHEILSLGDSMLMFGHPFRPFWRPFKRQRPAYATGLTLSDEQRRGWDVRIEFPRSPFSPSWICFLQFKVGKHKNYSRLNGSAFFGSNSQRNPFCRFGINNNSDQSQHIVLRNLATQPNLRGTVVYALPRIPSVATFKACLGRLIHVTSFVQVADLDAMAASRGVNIRKGQEHKFHTSYQTPPQTQEICSNPVKLEGLEDFTGHLVGEILAIRAYQALNNWKEVIREGGLPGNEQPFRYLFQSFEIQVAKYFGVPRDIFEAATNMQLDEDGQRILAEGVENHQAFERYYGRLVGTANIGQESLRSSHARFGLFENVAGRLARYRQIVSSPEWFTQPLQRPETNILYPLKEDGLTLNFKENADISDEHVLARALKTISYQAF